MSSKDLCQRRKISRSMRPRTSSQSEVTASPASAAAQRRSISCAQAASYIVVRITVETFNQLVSKVGAVFFGQAQCFID
jgi:hypothetical protein